MSAKPLRTRSKSASAERCLRPLGATIDMATPDPKTSNGFSVQGIFAWGFTKRQPGGRGGYRVLSLSGNCCKNTVNAGGQKVVVVQRYAYLVSWVFQRQSDTHEIYPHNRGICLP